MPKTRTPDINRYLAISRAVAGQLDFKKVLSEVAGEIGKLLPHDHMDVAIISPENPDFHVAYEVGVATGWGGAGAPQPIDGSPIRQLLRGEVLNLVTSDAWKDPRFHFEGAFDEPIFDARLHSRLHVPLQVHGKIHGALNISSHETGAYCDEDLEIAQNIADLMAPYFFALISGDQAEKSALSEGAARGRAEALRQGALRLTEGMERERRRIGMELHDQTLADLSRIYRHIERATRNNKPVAQELLHIGEELTQCTRELRRIIEDAKPGILELFGFQQAVEAQLERSVVGTVPPISTAVIDESAGVIDRCPDPVRTAIFRIVQEAVNNAVKHSGCKRIEISLKNLDHTIQICVTDNGSGPPGGWINSAGGMDNMRVRAALISAEILFEDCRETENTSVVISLPKEALDGRRGPAALGAGSSEPGSAALTLERSPS